MIKRLFIAITLFMLALAAFVYFILTTSQGLQLAVHISNWFIPGELKLSKVTGSLMEGAEFTQVNYHNDNITVQAQRLTGHWQLFKFLSGHYNINIDWKDLNIHFDKQHITADVGQASLMGDSTQYQLLAETNTRINQQANIPWKMKATGKDSELNIEYLSTKLANHQLMIKGTLDWKTVLHWNLQLVMDNINPNLFSSKLSGNLQVKINSEGSEEKATIELAQLQGMINDRVIAGKGSVSFIRNKLYIHSLNLYYGDANISMIGQLNPEWPISGNLQWKANIPNLHIIAPNLYGTLEAQGQVTGQKEKPIIKASVNTKHFKMNSVYIDQADAELNYQWNKAGSLKLIVHQMKPGATDTALQNIIANATWQPKAKGIIGDLNITAADNPPIVGQFSLPSLEKPLPLMQQPLTAKLEIKRTRIQFLDDLMPQIKDLNGQLDAHLLVGGVLGKPTLKGQLNLQQGTLSIPTLGIHLRDITLTANSDRSGKVIFDANLNSGKGQLSLKGNTQLFDEKLPTVLHLRGKNVEIIHNHEATVDVSPELTISIDDHRINFDGTITVPSAKITPDDFTSTETLPDDVVFTDEEEKDTPFIINSRIHLILGDNVSFSYAGLHAILRGELRLVDKTTGITTASGQLSVKKGVYKAYGTLLHINHGQLIFSGGPVTNPSLNVEASKQVRNYGTASQGGSNGKQVLGTSDVTVGVQVTGTINEPRLNLFSRPGSLKQSEILSLLLFGRATDSLTSSDASILLKAVPFFSSGGGEASLMKSQLEHKLGVTVNVDSLQEYDSGSGSMVENTSLILAKSLSPKLFIKYGIGLVKPINTLHIGYKVTNNLVIRTESNTNANGIDVLYTLER